MRGKQGSNRSSSNYAGSSQRAYEDQSEDGAEANATFGTDGSAVGERFAVEREVDLRERAADDTVHHVARLLMCRDDEPKVGEVLRPINLYDWIGQRGRRFSRRRNRGRWSDGYGGRRRICTGNECESKQ